MANSSQLFKDDEHEQAGVGPDDESRHATDSSKDGSPTDDRAASPDELKSAEKGGLYNINGDDVAGESDRAGYERAMAAAGGSLYKKDGDKKGGVRGQIQNARGRLSRLSQNKWMVGGIGGGSAALVGLIILLVLIAGSLKLPGVTQDIETYEFARVTRQFADSASEVTDETLGMDAASASTWSAIKERFTKNYDNVRESTWGRMDVYRPDQVMKNLGENNGLELNFKTSKITGREIFTGGKLNGVSYEVEEVTGIPKYIPGISTLIRANNEAVVRANLIADAVTTMKANNTSTLVRGPTAALIRRDSGGGLGGWLLEQFRGESGDAAQATAAQQMYTATQAAEKVPDNAATDEVKKADEDAEKQATTDSTSKSQVEAIDASNGDDPKVEKVVNADLEEESTFEKGVGVVNPVFVIFTPLCIIYDGSVQQSGPAIDDQVNQQEDAFDQLAAEADQQKEGDLTDSDGSELAAAIDGTNAEIGDISQSIPYQRAAVGEVDTTAADSPEAGADGGYTYSLYQLAGISPTSLEGHALNTVTQKACGALTNLKVGVGLALINIALGIGSLGEAPAAEDTAGAAAEEASSSFISNVVSNLTTKLTGSVTEKDGVKVIERGALSRAKRFAFTQGIVVGGTYGLTELAHLIVAARSGEANNGFAENTDLVNEADSGANLEGNALEQQELFGRPLSENELVATQQADNTYVTDANSAKSFSQRYFDTSNANSLLSRAAITLSDSLRPTLLATLTKLGSSLLHPLSSIASMFTLSGVAHATVPPVEQDYGNVQFGWSQAEEKLIMNNASYKPLENQELLDESGQSGAIANTYAKCFGYSYNPNGDGDFDPSDPSGDLQRDTTDYSIGQLLADGYITRDASGNVTNDGLCSPKNLGETGPFGDLMIRWRLALRYDMTLDQLINEQTVTSGDSGT